MRRMSAHLLHAGTQPSHSRLCATQQLLPRALRLLCMLMHVCVHTCMQTDMRRAWMQLVAKVYNINPHPHWEIFLALLCFLFALHLYWCASLQNL